MKKLSRKEYHVPMMKVIELKHPCSLLAGSVHGGSEYNLRYGGVDTDGEEDPD